VSIFRGFGNVLGAIGKNILTFDFTDSNKRVENAVKGLGNTFDDMQSQFDEGFRLLTTSLGEGIVSGEDAKPTGTKYENESMQEPSTPSGSPGSGGKLQPIHKQALDIISGPESGGNYNAMNNGNSGDRPGGSKKWLGKNLTDMTIGEVKQHQNIKKDLWAAGRYQIIPVSLPTAQSAAGLKDSDMFDKNNQDLLGIGLLKVQGPGAWSKYSKYSKEEISIMYKAKDTPLGKSQAPAQSTQKPAPAQTSSAQAAVSTSVIDQFKGKPGGAAGIITSERGMRLSPTTGKYRMHNGIDIAPAGPGYYVALKLSGKVNLVAFDSGGYGNYVDIKSGNTIYRFAHLAKVYVKQGQTYNGQTIGEIGSTGGSTGIHLHFEVRPGGGDSINPRPYLNLLSIGKQLTGTSGQPTTISAPTPVQIASQGTQQRQQVSQQLKQQKNGPTIVVIEEDPPVQPQVSAGGGGGGMIPIIINPLNSFITKKLLLDLAYT
jgi:murein DD-endopeptidase MepM/ murein hydrolase activator NlpD